MRHNCDFLLAVLKAQVAIPFFLRGLGEGDEDRFWQVLAIKIIISIRAGYIGSIPQCSYGFAGEVREPAGTQNGVGEDHFLQIRTLTEHVLEMLCLAEIEGRQIQLLQAFASAEHLMHVRDGGCVKSGQIQFAHAGIALKQMG